MATIQAVAHLNELTKEVDNDYYLTAQVKETLNIEGIIKRLRDREIATKNVDGPAFVQTFLDECARASAEGNNIITSFFRSSIGIQGVVLSDELGHNIPAERLKVSVNLTQGEGAKKAVEGAVVYAFEQAGATGPAPQSVMDPLVKKNNWLTPGCVVLIQGMRLALKGEAAGVGILFTKADGKTSVFIPAAKVYPNMPGKLQFNLPAEVTEGSWSISITTQANSNGSTLMKEPRTGTYPYTVAVSMREPGDDRPEEI